MERKIKYFVFRFSRTSFVLRGQKDVDVIGINHEDREEYEPGSFARLGRPKPVQITPDLKWFCGSTYGDFSTRELPLTTNPVSAKRKIHIDATTYPAITYALKERHQEHFARGETMGGKKA